MIAGLVVATTTACANEYHPEYHPETSYSYVQNVVVSPPQPPVVVIVQAAPPAPPASVEPVVAKLHATRGHLANKLEAPRPEAQLVRSRRPIQLVRAYAADDVPSP